MRARLTCSAVSMVLSVFAPVAWAAAAPKNTYLVGVEELDYFPAYSFVGERAGPNADHGCAGTILKMFAESAGVHFEFRPLPVKRLFRDFFEGKLDLKFPDNEKWAAKERVGRTIYYTKPLFDYVDGVMVLPERRGKGEMRRLGTVLGFTPFDFLPEIQAGRVTVKENAGFRELFLQTLKGSTDGAYVNVAVARRYLEVKMDKKDALVFDDKFPHTHDGYSLSTFQHRELVEKFDAFMVENKEKISEIRKRYGVNVE